VQEDQCTINPTLALLFYCIYMLVCVFIMLQLIVGVIVDNIEAAESQSQMAITQVWVRVCVWVCVCVCVCECVCV